MFDPTTIAAGGLIAVVAGFWTNFKTFVSYISSFVVLQARFDHVSANAIRVYLKRNYKVVPSGKLHFLTRVFWKDNVSKYVPFQTLHEQTVFYLGTSVLLYKSNNYGGADLMALRGTVDFQALLSSALLEREELEKTDMSRSSNFFISKIVGSEKGWGGDGRRSSHNDEQPVSGRGGDVVENSSGLDLDTQVDTSFMYAREVYSGDERDDPFKHLYYGPEIEKYIEQALQWRAMRSWYEERAIPWRRGWLLHGPGGTGKSSMAKALAMKMRIPLYQYQLATLSDQEFIREWDSMVIPSVVLFEDFDTVFNKRVSTTEHKLLTFDTVLNQISGVSTTNGLFLIVTTNRLDCIDEALGVECGMDGISTRPGRIDSVIHFGYINTDNRVKMAQQVLKDWPDAVWELVRYPGEVTPIQFQEMCITTAFARINGGTPKPRGPRNCIPGDFAEQHRIEPVLKQRGDHHPQQVTKLITLERVHAMRGESATDLPTPEKSHATQN